MSDSTTAAPTTVIPKKDVEINMSISGQFSRAGVDDEAPSGEFTKITEGFAAVLFPPAKPFTKKGGPGPNNSTATKDDEKEGAAASGPTANKKGDAIGFFINNEFGGNEDDQAVFYNPAQVVNRDLTICAMETFSRLRRSEPPKKGGVGDRGITIVEALSASGLRSVRYWKEITGLKYIIANDLDPDAVECMKRNLNFNKIPVGCATLVGNTPSDEWRGVVPNEDDAVVLMQRLGLDPNATLRTVGVKVVPPKNFWKGDRPKIVGPNGEVVEEEEVEKGKEKADSAQPQPQPQPQLVPLLQCEKMDIVDLDPYGSASPFLDPAMQCAKEGALLCVTSTDSSILCGTYPETAHAKYNSITIRHTACHEMAVRTLLAAIERTANKHKKYIVPLLSLHIDFYVRVFVRVYTQQAEVKLAATKLAHYFKCTRCPNFSVVPVGRVKLHGSKNNNNNNNNEGEGGAASSNNNKKNGKKERRADKREREEQEAVLAAAKEAAEKAGAGTASSVDASSSSPIAEAVEASSAVAAEATTAAEEDPSAPLPSAARCATNIPAFTDYTRQAPNAFPAVHDRSVPFSVNPSTIRNVSYECCVCHGAMAIAGPIYAAPIHNAAFLESLDKVIVERHSENRLTATNRIRGLVAAAKDELPLAPMFVEVPEIASLVRIPTPPLPEFVGAVCRLGYKASQVHCNHAGLKTDAPVDVLVGLMLDYQRRFINNNNNNNDDADTNNDTNNDGSAAVTASSSSLAQQQQQQNNAKRPSPLEADNGGRRIFVPAIEGDFSYSKEYDFKRMSHCASGNEGGIVKFVQNAPGWGPKARHRGVAREE